ncbi:type IX secretion system outer membrane channel protein PorV [Nemorincola caseinilytica]|uniref:Type IX secretion system outer membrane channel protein PorV n=2 Tax=Nemorincola caseinilytica TaxID=2054315 RepID=A0ABP8NBP2_9BACT
MSALQVNAQGTKSNVNGTSTSFVTTAVPFLRVSPDARAGAMGDAGIATSADPNAQYWNVAKMPFTDKTYGISATYTPWLKDLVPDIFLAYLSGYAKFGQEQEQAVSASMRYFSIGNINWTDYIGNSIGTGMPREYSFDLGYSRRLSDYLSAGLTMRYIHSAIASGVNTSATGSDYKPGNAFGADLGMFYTKSVEKEEYHTNTFNFGAVLSNIGSKITYNSTRRDFIPMNLGVGAAYTMQFDAFNKITFALDLNKLLVPAIASTSGDTTISVPSGIIKSFSTGDQLAQINVSLGAEYWYQNTIAFRAGYFYEDKNNGDRQFLTTGLGVRYNVFQLNASYLVPQGSGTNRNPLSNTLRFTLMFEFDQMSGGGGSDDSSEDTKPEGQ